MCPDENNEETFPERRERGRGSVKPPLIVSTEGVLEGLWAGIADVHFELIQCSSDAMLSPKLLLSLPAKLVL